MSNSLFKDIRKIVLFILFPSIFFLLFFYKKQPEITIVFLLGVILGIYRLKMLWEHNICVLDQSLSYKNKLVLAKYIFSIIINLGILGFMLYKSIKLGLFLLLGMLIVTISIMAYSTWQGIALYRKTN